MESFGGRDVSRGIVCKWHDWQHKPSPVPRAEETSVPLGCGPHSRWTRQSGGDGVPARPPSTLGDTIPPAVPLPGRQKRDVPRALAKGHRFCLKKTVNKNSPDAELQW
ncbi:hypothetical protein SKAU_G00311160 [Synaphobranchus kaupii]|uniref:Uncharacterized protein n=1 Tax=Synaphobranchus kaupii TaxID=118154 RepID=A0A9Q1ERT4_SYNKA|nr:hypothetical protein SKAU_G00311160 [Synaphobranchus kaupii]